MSRRDGGYVWRHITCDGCTKECRYVDFRSDPPVPSFAEIHAVLRARREAGNCRHRYSRRGTILGLMHDHKLALWEEWTDLCRQGLVGPNPRVTMTSVEPEKEELW